MICPPHTAHAVHRAWPESRLRMVTQAGHALSEPGITAELISIMDGLRAAG
jgi:proline iminopeptidase